MTADDECIVANRRLTCLKTRIESPKSMQLGTFYKFIHSKLHEKMSKNVLETWVFVATLNVKDIIMLNLWKKKFLILKMRHLVDLCFTNHQFVIENERLPGGYPCRQTVEVLKNKYIFNNKPSKWNNKNRVTICRSFGSELNWCSKL